MALSEHLLGGGRISATLIHASLKNLQQEIFWLLLGLTSAFSDWADWEKGVGGGLQARKVRGYPFPAPGAAAAALAVSTGMGLGEGTGVGLPPLPSLPLHLP